MRRSILIALVNLSMLAGCVERSPDLSPADRERLREFVGTEAPEVGHELNIRFDNGVTLLGYDVDGDTMRPGQTTTITWHWHAEQDLDNGWLLFTHVADGTGESRFNQDGVGVVRELYQPGRWQAGQYIRDVQAVELPNDWNNDSAVFYLGLWNGAHRLAIRGGNNDGENRVRALEMSVASAPSAAADVADEAPAAPRVRPPPTLVVEHAGEELTIDGLLEEASWQRAPRTSAFVNTLDGSRSPLRATARLLWDDDNLYVAFEVADDFLQNTLTARDAHLWEQDAVEIMIDPDGDGRDYFEIQVAPTGHIFDTRYDTRRQPQPIGHVDWNPNIVAAVSLEGTVNDQEADTGWKAEIAIPWDAFGEGVDRPQGGTIWRANLYVMDLRSGGGGQRTAGWSPTMERDFHVPARFGRLSFQAARDPAPARAAQGDQAPTAGTRLIPVPRIQLNPAAAADLRRQIQHGALRNPANPGVLPRPPR